MSPPGPVLEQRFYRCDSHVADGKLQAFDFRILRWHCFGAAARRREPEGKSYVIGGRRR